MSRSLGSGLFLLLLATAGASCVAGAKLREDAKLIRLKVGQARDAGAYRCAPAELARAEANLEFLDYELDQGDYTRAEQHHRIALDSVNRAIDASPPDQCADKRVVIAEGKPDRDNDKVADDVDQCPDEAEDADGFQDEDGCPDPDNDADTVPDVDDKCPVDPGPVANHGCPVQDRDRDTVADADDKCPDQAGIPENQGCPDADTDGDGVVDRLDKCPTEPEDKDGVQDEDGCPDPDNDGDGVLDGVDGCPNEAGPVTNTGCPVRDRDGDGITDDVDRCPDVPGAAPGGCPRRVLVVKTDKQIEIKKQILFPPRGARIKGFVSGQILDQVAAVLKSNPDLRIVIEGHTDNVGKAAFNLRLSDLRANAVRAALIKRGVDAGRLEAIGYGQAKPIASNKTKKGRAANRRVEFNIIQPKTDETPSDMAPLPPLPG